MYTVTQISGKKTFKSNQFARTPGSLRVNSIPHFAQAYCVTIFVSFLNFKF